MIEPIVLTKYGETLWTHPNIEASNELLPNCTGIHAICTGRVDTHSISATHKTIVCRKCAMKVLVPGNVKTYGDLRAFLAQRINSEPALDTEYYF